MIHILISIYTLSVIFNYFYFRSLYKNNQLNKEETIGSMIALIFIPFLNSVYAIFIIFIVYFSLLEKKTENEGLDNFFVLTYEELVEKERKTRLISLRKLEEARNAKRK